jgi:hypothetical protein
MLGWSETNLSHWDMKSLYVLFFSAIEAQNFENIFGWKSYSIGI